MLSYLNFQIKIKCNGDKSGYNEDDQYVKKAIGSTYLKFQ